MNIWNKVLLGLIAVLTCIAVWMTASYFGHQNKHQKAFTDASKELQRVPEDIRKATDGTDSEPGTRQLDGLLHDVLLDRGIVWKGFIPKQVSTLSPNQVSIQIVLDPDVTEFSQIEANSLVYVFQELKTAEETTSVGPFLGVFSVASSQGKTANLESAEFLTPNEIQNLRAGVADNTRWILYKSMPKDRTDVFAFSVSKDKKTHFDKIVPAPLAEAYANPKNNLIDFGVLVSSLFRERHTLTVRIDILNASIKSLSSALDVGKAEQLATQQDIDQLNIELAQIQKQGQEVRSVLDEMDRTLNDITRKISEQQSENENLVQKIADAQLKTVESIEKRGATQ